MPALKQIPVIGVPHNAADDQCTTGDIASSKDCGIEAKWNSWKQLEDKELQKQFGVYIKFKKCAVGGGTAAGCNAIKLAKYDEWRLHVADIENADYYISTEGERFITDDNDKVESINVARNDVSFDDVPGMARMLGTCPKLSHLDLSTDALTAGQSFARFVSYLAANP